MIFEQINPGPCLTYLVADEPSGQAILVDPVLDRVHDYLDLLAARKFVLTHVIDTHSHADHLSGAPALRDLTDCEYVAHQDVPAVCVSHRVDDGDALQIGSIRVEIIATPGHTMDSISLVIGDKLLTRDVLFLDDGGAGRDDLTGGDPGMHFDSLQKIAALDDHLLVCPAHDYHDRKPSSLATQRSSNPHLQFTDREAFIEYLEDLKLGPADWMNDVLKANYACARDPGAVWIPADAPACEVKGTLGANDIAVMMISADELAQTLRSQPPLLLDVRDADELAGELGHIPGIRHIPVTDLAHRLAELDDYRESDVVTVCRSGARAETAAQILMQDGFAHVRVLQGGMQAWKAEGLTARQKVD